MTSKQKLKRIAELLAVGRSKLEAKQWQEICSLSGNEFYFPAKEFNKLKPSPDLERAKMIRGIVAKFYGMPESTLWMPNRTESVSWARHVAMALIAKELPAMADETIGNLFNRDHGIVRHALRRIKMVMNPTMPREPIAQSRFEGLKQLQAKLKL